VEAFLATAAMKQPPPVPPQPPVPPPITGHPPPYVPPIIVPPRIPWPHWTPPRPQGGVPPVDPRPRGSPPPTIPSSGPGSGIVDWLKTSLGAGATVLGIAYSGSMWAIRGVTLQKALDAAWLVFQIEEGGLKSLVGLAGEAALEAILPDILGIDPKYVRNLNELATSFPVLDLISARGVYSVKTYGIVSKATGQELIDQIVSKYKNDFLNMVLDQTGAFGKPMEKCVRLLFENQDALRAKGQWPSALRGRTEQAIRKYIQEEGLLVIPSDHVQPARRGLGKHLNEMRLSGKLPGANPLWIQKQVFRIQGGVSSTDLSGIVESTKHLPKEQYDRLHREFDAVIRARKRKP
jgi:hypothetical protein